FLPSSGPKIRAFSEASPPGLRPFPLRCPRALVPRASYLLLVPYFSGLTSPLLKKSGRLRGTATPGRRPASLSLGQPSADHRHRRRGPFPSALILPRYGDTADRLRSCRGSIATPGARGSCRPRPLLQLPRRLPLAVGRSPALAQLLNDLHELAQGIRLRLNLADGL